MSEHEFAIPVRDLDAAGKSFSFPVRAAWLHGAFEGTELQPAHDDGKLELRLSKSGTDVVVRGHLKADLTVPCARCLEPAHIAVDQEVSALMVPKAAIREAGGTTDEGDSLEDEDDVIPFDGETVVLDELVRDELMLAVPMIPLCSDACPGIRAGLVSEEAPAAPEVDPRLRPLLRLKKSST